MKNKDTQIRWGLIFLLLGVIKLSSCEHYKPLNFPKQNVGKEGPGLLSGEKGYFEVGLPS
jgi:hypothetical protein